MRLVFVLFWLQPFNGILALVSVVSVLFWMSALYLNALLRRIADVVALCCVVIELDLPDPCPCWTDQ